MIKKKKKREQNLKRPKKVSGLGLSRTTGISDERLREEQTWNNHSRSGRE